MASISGDASWHTSIRTLPAGMVSPTASKQHLRDGHYCRDTGQSPVDHRIPDRPIQVAENALLVMTVQIEADRELQERSHGQNHAGPAWETGRHRILGGPDVREQPSAQEKDHSEQPGVAPHSAKHVFDEYRPHAP